MLLLKTQSFLQALSSISLGGILKAILGYIFLAIDSVVYFFVSQGFKMYIALAQFKLFDDKVFDDLINRTYIIIGVIALFIVAYALLNSIINPDNASKGDKSLSKIVKNFIFAIIGIAIVPTAFNYFYYFQRVVLCNNLIPKILLSQKGDDSQADLLNDDKIGTQFATYLFQSFFYPKSIENMNMTDVDNDGDLLKSEAVKVEVGLIDDVFSDEENVNIEKYKDYDSDNKGNYNLQMAYEGAMNGEMFFTAFRPFLLGDVGFANSVLNNTVNYMIIISTIAGVYCAYVLASLCIDMAIRAVKLGYLELIAPLPIMTLIVPGKDGVFKAWIKKTGSCAFEVFTRLFIVSFVIYLIRTIPQLFTATSFSYGGCTTSFGIITALLIRALVYCGLLTFLKQAPKFLSEATGIKSDGFKLGIADKLGEMALIGGAAKNGVRAAQGAATGALGGLATGLFNRDKVDWKSAVMQGATQGFKGKGNQFLKQRKSTFQKIAGNTDKDQGLFGGESKISKFINNHKNDVKNSSGEIANSNKYKGQNSEHYQGLKDEFTNDKIRDRISEFENSDIHRQAEQYAAERMKALGTSSKEVHDREIANFLNNAKAYTTDENLKRKITEYENDLDIQDKRKKYEEAQRKLNVSAKDLESAKSNLTQARINLNNKNQEVSSKNTQIETENNNLNTLNTNLKTSKTEMDTSKATLDSTKIKLDTSKSTLDAATSKVSTLNSDLANQEVDLRNAAKMLHDVVGKRLNVQQPNFDTCSVQELNDYINDCYLDTQNDNLTSYTRDQINQVIKRKDEYQKIKSEYDSSKTAFNTAQADYNSVVSDYSSKENEYNAKKANYDTIAQQVEQQETSIKTLRKEYEELQKEKAILEQKERKAQEQARKLYNEREENKTLFDSTKTAFIDSVDNGVEQVYNGTASVRHDGADDLASVVDDEQRRYEQEYRSAKQGITDMGKKPTTDDYLKQLIELNKKKD